MSISTTIMEFKGFKARIMEAERLTGDGTHGLPPGTALNCYPADIFKEYPESWMKGPGVFVVPVRANKGLWFDWTQNSPLNTAVLPTVKGCNPITGMQTSGFHLERYDEKCPKHGTDFLADRFCEKCGYRWPSKNYVSGTSEILWWDGFRSEDGTVRQFFFTEDEIRDIASHMIGKENTVPAFGFAFYNPKEMRQGHPTTQRGSSSSIFIYNDPGNYSVKGSWPYWKVGEEPGWLLADTDNINITNNSLIGSEGSKSTSCYNMSLKNNTSPISESKETYCNANMDAMSPMRERSMTFGNIETKKSIRSKNVSVGAGAKISQQINVDPYSLDSWKDKPSASMTIYFVFKEKLEDMLSKGVRDLSGKKEGMLNNLPVG